MGLQAAFAGPAGSPGVSMRWGGHEAAIVGGAWADLGGPGEPLASMAPSHATGSHREAG
jgi:hypothetical protein